MICFFQFFFVQCSNNFFSIKIINNISIWHSIFNFFNHKNFFRPIWNVTSPILNLGSLLLISLLESIYVFHFTSAGFILFDIWYLLLYLLTISSNLSIYKFFWNWGHAFINFISLMISLISCKIHYICLPIFYLVCVLIHLNFFEKPQ